MEAEAREFEELVGEFARRRNRALQKAAERRAFGIEVLKRLSGQTNRLDQMPLDPRQARIVQALGDIEQQTANAWTELEDEIRQEAGYVRALNERRELLAELGRLIQERGNGRA